MFAGGVGYRSPEAAGSGWIVGDVLMAPKLTSCDVMGMVLKYWLSTEAGFVGGERLNSVGALFCRLVSLVVTGGDMTCS